MPEMQEVKKSERNLKTLLDKPRDMDRKWKRSCKEMNIHSL